MTLQNLLRIGRLKEHAATAAEVQRLLAAVDRNLTDAAQTGISDETRFDAAYKAVMQCALAAMLVQGYRPSTSEPGHHVTLIQSLPLTLGVDNTTWVLLDALRRKPHPTHAHLALSLEWMARAKPTRGVLTNMHLDLDYATLAAELPDHICPAYDGMILELPAP